MAQVRVARSIAADPTSTALLLAARRTPTGFVAVVPLGGVPATVTLSRAGDATVVRLDFAGDLRLARDFLAELAQAAEQRADAA